MSVCLQMLLQRRRLPPRSHLMQLDRLWYVVCQELVKQSLSLSFLRKVMVSTYSWSPCLLCISDASRGASQLFLMGWELYPCWSGGFNAFATCCDERILFLLPYLNPSAPLSFLLTPSLSHAPQTCIGTAPDTSRTLLGLLVCADCSISGPCRHLH